MEIDTVTRGGFLARGIFGLIVGILCFVIPVTMQSVIAYLIGIFLLVLSILTGGVALSSGSVFKHRILVAILSIIGIIIAILIFVSPIWMVILVTFLVALWLIIMGIAELFLAISLEGFPHRFLLWLTGFISLIFGFLIGAVPFPTQGSLLMIILVGVFFLIFGILNIIIGLLLNKGDAVVTVTE